MIIKAILSPQIRADFLAKLGLYSFMSNRMFLKKMFKLHLGYKLDLSNPKTFNAKLQWLKLYDCQPEYTTMVDKYAVKKLIAERIGAEYVVPLLGVWDSAEQIDFASLPNSFVLKTNHDSKGVLICKDKELLDIKTTRSFLKKQLSSNGFWFGREWPYKNVQRKIIAEELLQNESGAEVKDYKVWCFNGIAKCTMVCSGRFSEEGLHNTFYDREWNVMPVKRPSHPIAEIPDEKPINYEKMIEIAEKLSQRIPFLRVDFYEVGGKLYFGELTFYPAAGFEGFEPAEWDYTFGEWLKLPIDDEQK